MAADRIMSGFLSHRIGGSRIIVTAFFFLLLFTESSHEGSMTASFLFLFGLVLVGIAVSGRLWCALYISGYKSQQLITTGPYSLSRNPLYFFSFLGFTGIGFCTETYSLGFVFMAFFMAIYVNVIRKEETFLLGKFGREFEEYAAITPRFFPRLRGLREPESHVVDPRRFRRAVMEVIWFVWMVGLIEVIEALHDCGIVTPFFGLP